MSSTPLISDRFELVRQIGEGSFAMVLEVLDRHQSDRRVVLKRLKESRLRADNREWAFKQFMHEMEVLQALDSPHTPKYLANGFDGTLPYLAMEYAGEQTLDLWADRHRHYWWKFTKPLSVELVLEVMRQLTSVVHHAHERGIVHRDLRPANILLTNRPGGAFKLQLVDWGSAFSRGQDFSPVTVGSVSYSSPGQTRGDFPEPQDDIWSLGVLLYELLTGKHPSGADTYCPDGWQRKSLVPIQTYRKKLPPAIVKSLQKALSVNSGDNFSSANDFWRSLTL